VGRDNQYIEPVHLMAALLDQQGGTARPLLGEGRVQVPSCARIWPVRWTGLPKVEGAGGEVLLGNDLKQAVECDGQAGAAARRSIHFQRAVRVGGLR